MPGLRDKLRAICHEVRMRPLQGEPNQLAQLQLRVAKLPSPESILTLSDEALKQLRALLDRLIYDLDRHENNRSLANGQRHQHRTGLPPMRQPLTANWYQTAMTKESADNFFPDMTPAQAKAIILRNHQGYAPTDIERTHAWSTWLRMQEKANPGSTGGRDAYPNMDDWDMFRDIAGVTEHEKLAYYRGRYYWLEQETENDYHLYPLRDDGTSVMAPKKDCRIVQEPELSKQLEAIRHFAGVVLPACIHCGSPAVESELQEKGFSYGKVGCEGCNQFVRFLDRKTPHSGLIKARKAWRHLNTKEV